MKKQANILGQNPFGQYRGVYSPRALFPDIRGITRGSTWEWALGLFTNASDRLIDQGGTVTGPFTSGILATRTIDKHIYALIEKEITQKINYSHRLDNAWWDSYAGDALAEPNVTTDPLGTTTACRVTTVNTTPTYAGARKHGPAIGASGGVISAFIKAGSQGNKACIRLIGTAPHLLNITPTASWVRYQWRTAVSAGAYPVIYNCWDGDTLTGLTVGDNHYWWGVQVELGEKYAHSPIINNSGGALTKAKDILIMPNAVVPAWLKASTTPFTTNLVFNDYSSVQLAADGGKKYLFSVDGTSDIECYLNGADNKIYIDQGGVNKFTSTAKTWAIGANPKVSILPDNGSSACVVITSGFATGDGLETGAAFIQQSDGIWSIGSKFATDDQQLDGMIAEFRPGYV